MSDFHAIQGYDLGGYTSWALGAKGQAAPAVEMPIP
jgi:hypothetical protein